MSKKKDSQVIALDDLESRRFWAAIIAMVGLTLAVYGLGTLLTTTDKALDQLDALSDRVERLTEKPLPSEPAKT